MQLPIRAAVVDSPDYPFSPVQAPVKLDQNESAQDFPVALKEQVLQGLRQTSWNRYTDLHSDSLCETIAAYEHWPASGVVAATGSNVLILLLIQLSALDARVLTVKPNFALYGLDAKLLGAALTELPLRADFSVDVDAVIEALNTPEPLARRPGGVIYLPRPHAPTGSVMTLADVERIAAAATGWLTVIDEAYCQFGEDSAIDIARRYPHVLLLRTFSKAWGLAGLRLGYALTSDEVARQLRKLVPPFATTAFQTLTAQTAMGNPGYMREWVNQTVSERERVFHALQRHPSWEVFPSATNFLLVRTPDAVQAVSQLLAAGVLVRRQDSLHGLQGCFRVTLGTPQENNAFLRAAGL